MVTAVSAVTGEVVMVKLANPEPAGIKMLAGTWAAAGLLLDIVTSAPPGGAAALRNKVAGMLFPPVAPPTLGVTGKSSAPALGSAPPDGNVDVGIPPVLASARTEV